MNIKLLLIVCIAFVCVATETQTYKTLCPSLVGSTVSNTSFLESTYFGELIAANETTTLTCNFTQCAESARRLYCNNAYTRAGLLDVNVDKHFPFLSYNKPTPLAGPPKPIITKVKKSLTIAYILLVHENFVQITRLMKSIYHVDNVYVLHVDKKASVLKNELVEYYSNTPNVHILERSYNIKWGGIDMIYATLEGMFALLDMHQKWDFVINLSSKDYPLCNNDQLTSYLETRKGSNFDIASLPDYENEKFWRSRAMYVDCDPAVCYQFQTRALPFGVPAYVTSQWFIYSREFTEYLRTSSFPKVMLAHYEHTWIPDEGYFGTVLMNSPFKVSRIPHNLRFIVFDEIHPYYFTEKDLPMLQQQTDCCFSRKFDVNASILDRIDELLASGPRTFTLP